MIQGSYSLRQHLPRLSDDITRLEYHLDRMTLYFAGSNSPADLASRPIRYLFLDEIQNVPEILNYIRSFIDQNPHKNGQWLLTGSQEAPLMKGVAESMAGRAAIFQLLPFSHKENSKVSIFKGGFPEVLAKPKVADIWFRSYIQTYLERDVRFISSIRDLSVFRRFLSLLATRTGQILNRTDLAAPLGVSVPTISEWLSILEITSQIIMVPPFFENFGKRLVKSPKIYFTDSGLACHLLGIESEQALFRSPFLGAIFEGAVASEILKRQLHSGKRRDLYYLRDQYGLEVDFLVPTGDRNLVMIEAKASRTVVPSMAKNMQKLMMDMDKYQAQSYVVHLSWQKTNIITALCPGIKALSIAELDKVF